MTEEISLALQNASILAEIEDIYRPFRPKRRTRATIAKEKGFVEAGDLSVLTAGIPSPHIGGFDYGVSNMMRIVTIQ